MRQFIITIVFVERKILSEATTLDTYTHTDTQAPAHTRHYTQFTTNLNKPVIDRVLWRRKI